MTIIGLIDVDLTAEITAICDKLGLKPADVCSIQIEPRQITVSSFRRNENDSKYVDMDSGYAATETATFGLRWTS